MRQKGKAQYSGFTLIELLVVIAIIAILAAILFPVFSAARGTAKKTSCANNIKQLGAAIEMYKSEYNGFFPLGGFKFSTQDYSREWQNAIYRYVKSEKLFRCPNTICPPMDPANPKSYGSDINRPRMPVTYLYNMRLGANMESASQAYVYPKSHHESEVRKPTKCIMLIDGNAGVLPSSFQGTDGAGRKETLWLREYCFDDFAAPITGGNSSRKSYGLPHHGDGGNVVFVDGHCKYFKYENQQTLQKSLPWMVHVPLMSCDDEAQIKMRTWRP